MPQVQSDSPPVCEGFQITFEHQGPSGGTDGLSSLWGLGVRNQAADPTSCLHRANTTPPHSDTSVECSHHQSYVEMNTIIVWLLPENSFFNKLSLSEPRDSKSLVGCFC